MASARSFQGGSNAQTTSSRTKKRRNAARWQTKIKGLLVERGAPSLPPFRARVAGRHAARRETVHTAISLVAPSVANADAAALS